MANLLGNSMLPLAMARAVQPSSLWGSSPAINNPAQLPDPVATTAQPVMTSQSFGGPNVGNGASAQGLFFQGSKSINDALAANAALPRKQGTDWKSILAYAVSGAAAGMGNPYPLQALNDTMRDRRNQEAERQRFEAEQFAKQQERMSPRFEQVGNTIGMFDPGSGNFNAVYTAPGVSGQYALDRGFQPGTPEYAAAVQEQRMGSWSDPAMDARRELEGVRYGYRDDLQDQRLDVTRRGQDMHSSDARRGQDITRGNNIRSNQVSAANATLRAQTERGSYGYSHGRGSGKAQPGGIAEGTIIKNPQTGQRMKMQGGQWVTIK